MPKAKKLNNIINPDVILKEMKARLPGRKIEAKAAECLAAVLDYTAAELLERSGNVARSREGKTDGVTVHPEDIQEVLDTTDLGDII